jgi:hypothetical protein
MKKYSVRTWTGLNWFRIASGRISPQGPIEVREVDYMIDSSQGPCFMELVKETSFMASLSPSLQIFSLYDRTLVSNQLEKYLEGNGRDILRCLVPATASSD